MDLCPWCDEQETVAYVLECKDPKAVLKFQELVKKLDQWIKTAVTAPDIWEVLTKALLCWKKGEKYNQPTYLREEVEEAFAEQEQIGWGAFLEGFVSKRWRDCQQ